MRVLKWGSSLAVCLPAEVVEALSLAEGDDVEVRVVGARSLEVGTMATNAELLARLRKYRGRLPKGFCFDRSEAHRQSSGT